MTTNETPNTGEWSDERIEAEVERAHKNARDLVAKVFRNARPVEESLRILDEQDTTTTDVEALIGRLERAHTACLCDLPEASLAITDSAATLRTLTARIVELEGQVEQARREGAEDLHRRIAQQAKNYRNLARQHKVGSKEYDHFTQRHDAWDTVAVDIGIEIVAGAIPSADSIAAQAAKAERAKCGERIEKMAGTLKTTAERLHSEGKFADAARYMDYSGAMLSFGKQALAFDHLEANGREQG